MNLANMTRDVAEDVKGAGAELMERAARMKEGLSRNAEEAMDAARRTGKKVRRLTEDALEETRHEIKERPLAATAVAGFAGAVLGLAAGWYLASRHRCSKCE
jgi:ElaB/YqjD/DUF883 family membrane-anchored ribosome-binding protein